MAGNSEDEEVDEDEDEDGEPDEEMDIDGRPPAVDTVNCMNYQNRFKLCTSLTLFTDFTL